jgi:hypothetical protein
MSPAVQRIAGYGNERSAAENELRRSRVYLPLEQHSEWQKALGWANTILLIARDDAGSPVDALSMGVSPSRALPGNRLYRVVRLAVGRSLEVRQRLVAALLEELRQDPRCLRLSIELFDRNSAGRESLRTMLVAAGFRRPPWPRMYRHTLMIDLRPGLDQIFASMHSSARYNVRVAQRRGFELRPIVDPALAPHLQALSRASFNRTGAPNTRQPWPELIELSVAHPDVSRIVGLFRPGHASAEGPVAFAWGCAHGDYAVYDSAGSRRTEDLQNMPLGYAPLWDLIKWARERTAATWFDLGGTQPEQAGDSLPGIAKFKRRFSTEVVEVGEEWQLEPHPARAAVARVISAAANWATRRAAALRTAGP